MRDDNSLGLLLLQVAVVTVAFPATPLLLARARICISAAHTREDLIKALEVSLSFLYFLFNVIICTGTTGLSSLVAYITSVVMIVGHLLVKY